MAGESNIAPPPGGSFIRPLSSDDEAIGGKARSLARLAALGLSVPGGFAIDAALFRRLRSAGPPLPRQLVSAADVTALEAARDALETAAFPCGFDSDLARALDACTEVWDVRVPTHGFAVRSSIADEDRTGALGAGIYLSVLRVPRDGVASAVRRVLGSCLSPAAWVYHARLRRMQVASSGRAEDPGVSVLIHPFVEGDAAGTAALGAATGLRGSGAGVGAEPDMRVDVHVGKLSAGARGTIDHAVRAAFTRYGAVEIEWVAYKDTLTVLQLRGYQPAPDFAAQRQEHEHPDDRAPDSAASDPGWTWDAAHNPTPLSPAQTGLVELVDARCRIGVQQKVVGGYLFFRRTEAPPPAVGEISAREAFDRLAADIEPRLRALGPEPSLAAAIELFVAAYEPLFGLIGAAYTAARRKLQDFLDQSPPAERPALTQLLAGVPSAASRRQAAVRAIAAATTPPTRQAAIDAYVTAFGDESPRWDVSEPTLRETPEVFLPLALRQPGPTGLPDPPPPSRDGDDTGDSEWPADPTERQRFLSLVVTAREATAVHEDDDALYARLQAGVRRALLGVGHRLHAAGRLDSVDDVFYLPLSLTRALEPPDPTTERDLKQIAAAGRAAFRLASTVPPPVDRLASPTAEIIRGQGGAGGRMVGRAVHHPASTPLGPESVLIASTLLPTELPLLAPGGIVVETGSILDHVAAQSRERGIPAVVGAAGARAHIPEGALVVVDGDRGEVVLLVGS